MKFWDRAGIVVINSAAATNVWIKKRIGNRSIENHMGSEDVRSDDENYLNRMINWVSYGDYVISSLVCQSSRRTVVFLYVFELQYYIYKLLVFVSSYDAYYHIFWIYRLYLAILLFKYLFAQTNRLEWSLITAHWSGKYHIWARQQQFH